MDARLAKRVVALTVAAVMVAFLVPTNNAGAAIFFAGQFNDKGDVVVGARHRSGFARCL